MVPSRVRGDVIIGARNERQNDDHLEKSRNDQQQQQQDERSTTTSVERKRIE